MSNAVIVIVLVFICKIVIITESLNQEFLKWFKKKDQRNSAVAAIFSCMYWLSV